MPVVGFAELHMHASDQRYGLAVVNIDTLSMARGIVDTATELDAPVAIAVSESRLLTELLPSLEAMVRRAPVPIGLVASGIDDAAQTVLAIRSGCNALMLAQGLEDAVTNEIHALAAACGVPVIEWEQRSAALIEIDDELESETLKAITGTPASWQALDDTVAQAAAAHLRRVFTESGASGQGRSALTTCKPWRPVEHLIVYNTTCDEAASERLAAEGRRILDRIPGVRATWSGCSVNTDASYRWCWLIRFAHPAVIDSYREHPDHVAYADNHFRPSAGDRISIDFELTGADENAV